jgi:hypothetical protein
MFQDFMVEDLIGQIPKDVREPSVAFLAKGRETLTRYFLYQSYSIQRRAVADINNAERFHGMLVFMKFLLALMEGGPSGVTIDPIIEEPKEDPAAKVAEFAKGMKELKAKK